MPELGLAQYPGSTSMALKIWTASTPGAVLWVEACIFVAPKPTS